MTVSLEQLQQAARLLRQRADEGQKALNRDRRPGEGMLMDRYAESQAVLAEAVLDIYTEIHKFNKDMQARQKPPSGGSGVHVLSVGERASGHKANEI